MKNPDAKKENARTLAAAVGVQEEEAGKLLEVVVAVTFQANNPVEADFGRRVEKLLDRTIESVSVNGTSKGNSVAVELVIGKATAIYNAKHLYVTIGDQVVQIALTPIQAGAQTIHPIGLLIGACYAVGAVLKLALGDLLRFPFPDVYRVDLKEMAGGDVDALTNRIDFEEAYLAGAGAIGNGFLLGLSQFDVHGTLHVVDDDNVSGGNLQRCYFFADEDIGLPKPDVLKREAQPLLPKVTIIPQNGRLQNHPNRRGGPWLKRLIVGVDSPRARRALQSEIPKEVYDASTTGIEEIVLHFNRQPTDLACMSCIYYETPQEEAHEIHIAGALGVTLAEVKQQRISAAAAKTICQRYGKLDSKAIEGVAYDTLFKQLCSTAQLRTPEGRQVLAPFAFISVLAGALLALEFVRRVERQNDTLHNKWRLSPWNNPNLRCRQTFGRLPDCEFCGNELLAKLAASIWCS